MPKYFLYIFIFLSATAFSSAQTYKALFDNTKNETAGNADWIIDTQQPIPSPAQSGITTSTPETYWLGAISAWGVDLVKLGFTVHTLTSSYGITYGNAGNLYDLSNYNLFIVCEPQNPFSAAEKLAIKSFVQNGGGLMMVADHNASDRDSDGWDSPEVWNDLRSDSLFGIHFQSGGETNNYITGVYTNIETGVDSIINGSAGTVTALSYHGGTSMRLTSSNTSARGHIWMNGISHGTTQIVAATSRYGLGKVAGIGDSSPADDGTGQSGNTLYNGWTEAGATDNIVFLNTCLWLVSPQQSPPAQVVLVSPNDLSTEVTIPTTFKWRQTSTATKYQFDLSTSNTFSTFIISDTSLIDTTTTISSLALNTTYYWRVRAKNNSGWGAFSAIRSFTTWNVPSQIVLAIPSDASSMIPIPTICKWRKETTATKYQYDLSTSNTFTSYVVLDSTLVDTATTIPGLLLNTTYYWRVLAKNNAGWGAYSSIWFFTTWDVPPSVQLELPADSSIDLLQPIVCTWHIVPDAVNYKFELASDYSFSTIAISDSNVVDSVFTIPNLSGGSYYWRVSAKNAAGWGPPSLARMFSVLAVPDPVQLISPPNGITGLTDTISFTWNSISGISRYNFQISVTKLFDPIVYQDSTMSDTTFSITGLDSLQRYYWRVRAMNIAGWGLFSEIWSFTRADSQVISFRINQDWNIVSLPFTQLDERKSVIFPSAISSAFLYDNVYVPCESLAVGRGYWLKFDSAETITLKGIPNIAETLNVSQGWNLIGSTANTCPVELISTIPPGIIISEFYQYDINYTPADSLRPMLGYWLKVSQAGKLILNNFGNASVNVVGILRKSSPSKIKE
ncbi:MAG: hypothetical protein C0417_05825 [Chlorobiaceae bacterium]|nr:hypothetical protein [Chlorobiaceae bacterium]